MQAKRVLYSKRLSTCCAHHALIVRSREGGFVSQNCPKCGKPDYINEQALPDLCCDQCQTILKIERLDRQNYFYVCHQCKRSWQLSDVIPHWSDLFQYAGLAVNSDFGIEVPRR